MISFVDTKKLPKDEEVLALLRPYVKEWFKRNFKELTLPQKFSIPLIKKGKNVLITSPTGSGKTLACFCSILDELFLLGEKNELQEKVYCIYISPLRALDNDIYRNLIVPLKEIREIANEMGINLPEVRCAVRTGDTLPSERQQQLKRPPHILITTPESIAIILSTRKFKEKLKDVKWVIVDECLPYDAKVELPNGSIKIGELVEKNLKKNQFVSQPKDKIFVKSFDLKEKKIVNKEVLKVHKIPVLKPLIKIHTKLFFLDLEMTENHPVPILENNKITWRKASELKKGDRILVYNDAEAIIPQTKKEKGKLILTEEKFKKVYFDIFKGKDQSSIYKLNKYIKRFKELGLIPLTSNSEKIFTIMRLLGHLFGDGWITITDKTCHIGFSGQEEDLKIIEKEIEELGFKVHSKSSRVTSSRMMTADGVEYNITGISSQYLVCSKPLAVFFVCLGAPIGDKVMKSYKLPKWLCSSNNEIIKEFLSSFLGSEGASPSPARYNYFYAPRISIYKNEKLRENLEYFSKQLLALFKKFGIEAKFKIEEGNRRKDGVKTIRSIFTFKNSEENLSRLFSLGIRYCKRKEEITKDALNYLKAKLFARKNLQNLIKKIVKLKKKQRKAVEIAEETGINFFKGRDYRKKLGRLIYDLIRGIKKKRQLRGFPSFQEFRKKYIYKGLFVDEITSVFRKKAKQDFVYDLTVKDTHNFFANSVLVHNCHELADSKRGVHLSLSLERLQNFVGRPFVRIGAGATLEPLDACARFLVGYENGKERDCKIIDARFVKKMDIKLLSPTKNLLYTPAEVTTSFMYKLLDKLIKGHKTTLVFTNTRSGTERCVHHLKQMFPNVYTDEQIGAHHSSVSREIRHEIEDKLKRGELKVCVSSTSLELGIDIGHIDLVVQLGSPKSITRLVQRIGRGGHTLEKTSVGRVIAMDRDDQVELAVMIQQAYSYFLDKIQIPENCLDVLAQHLVGMSLERKWSVREAFNLIRNSYCYRNLELKTFISVLEFLSGAYHSLEERKVYGKIWFDPKDMMFGRRGKYARVIYSLNIGTIPDEVKIKVRTLDGRYIGSIEEEFLQRLMPGDIFVLAGKTYEFVKARQLTAYVKPVKEKRPTVPAWFSEMLPLSFELALKIQEFRGKMFKLVKEKKKGEVIRWLLQNYRIDEWSANSIYEYFLWEYKFLKALNAKRFPDEKTILVENYIDERGNQNLIFHTLFGRRINDALSRAFGYLLTKKLKKSVGLTISDNGFVISIPCESLGKGWLDIISLKEKIRKRESERVDPREVVKLLKSENLREVLRKALRQTELIKRRFRHCATRSLMILRNYKGYEIKVARQQLNADRLLKICEKFENFPVVEETYREVMQDFMDLERAKWVLEQVEKGKIKYEFLPESNVPSPFSHTLIALGESDVVLMEDRKKLLLELHKKVMEKVKQRNH